jgi:hypothetical protein
MAARLRQAREGGSWKVSVALATTGHWLRSLGRIDGLAVPDQDLAAVQDLLEPSSFGPTPSTAISHAAQLSATPARWTRGASELGQDQPVW